jgi:murein DD-endopeptidase MepM/ murein hydrolase activator NlpD
MALTQKKFDNADKDSFNILAWLKTLFNNDWVTNRASIHLTVVLLVALALGLSNAHFSWNPINAIHPLKRPTSVPEAVSITAPNEKVEPLALPVTLNNSQSDVLVRAAAPHTIIPDRSKEEIKTYVVEFGDTIVGIAQRYGLNPETIMWSNPTLGDNPDLLRVGQELVILPINGVYHQVGSEDTIEGIAATYKADPTAIIAYPLNKLDPENPVIQPGQWLVVPDGEKPYVPRTVTAYSGPPPDDATKGTGAFGWPASGKITQDYWAGHPGLDIAGWVGAPVAAADSGHVVAAGWSNSGYGNFIVIDHGNGFQTLYGHLNAFLVNKGDNVAKGQTIAEMGTTGNSTGPHLHFEIRQGTVQRNPYGFLP